MAVDRGMRARLRYRSDEFLSGGAGRQLGFLFALTMLLVVVFAAVAMVIGAMGGEVAPVDASEPLWAKWLDRSWWYFARFLDAGTMGGDEGQLNRVVSSIATIFGVIVAGLLISSLAGNFQERLESIKRGASPVLEQGHFLILGWSEKIYSVIDQLAEAYISEHLIVVVMAEGDKIEMEEKLRDKVVHQDRVKIVVRSGNSVALNDLSKVSFDRARAIIVLLDEKDADLPSHADGRIIKTLMALFNHPDIAGRAHELRVTAEVMLGESQDIASIASGGRAHVIKTNEIISKIILQTCRIGGLGIVYDELLRFEGNEIHYTPVPAVAGRPFGQLLLDFPNGCVVGVAKRDGSSHVLNPPADYVIGADEELLVLAEDDDIPHVPYAGPLRLDQIRVPPANAVKKNDHMLVLGWNEKAFPIIAEFDAYVGPGSSLTIVSTIDAATREREVLEKCPDLKNTTVRHVDGDFTSRGLMEQLQPALYPTVMVLGQPDDGGAEAADTRAIIALLLLRDFRARTPGRARQRVCSEILEPKNRELAATTELNDIIISNSMVSMVLAQTTYEPRVRPVLEDLFRSEGSEVYIKDLSLYVPNGQPTTFEHLLLAAKARGEVAMGLQIANENPADRYGLRLNPVDTRATPFIPKAGDRLVVLAEEDG